MITYYFIYFLGAVITLFSKYITYITYQDKEGDSLLKSTMDWFFEPSLNNASSWIATLAGVWLGGAIYIEKIPLPYVDSLFDLPLNYGICFFLGVVMEAVAPFITKFVVNKLRKILHKVTAEADKEDKTDKK